MMRILLTLLLVLPCISFGQVYSIPVISRDSLLETDSVSEYFDFGKKWLFHQGDDTAWADPLYNEQGWDTLFSDIRYVVGSSRMKDTFSSIGWFRYHFIADTSIVGVPLALRVTQFGASEIYLDGKRIGSYGKIRGKNSVYYDPQRLPLTFFVTSPGTHVFAVRYANYNARLNATVRHNFFSGFRMTMSTANNAIRSQQRETLIMSFICAVLLGFFIAFCMAHLFLYFFYRASVSNLYFSIFCLCLGISFIMFFINRFSSKPGTEMWDSYLAFFVLAVGNFSFSGFTNSLFGKRKLRFKIVAAISLLAPVIMLVNGFAGFVLGMVMLVFVFVEATIITIAAIVRKVKGARIIGAGILFLAFFCLGNVIWGTLPGNHEVTDGTLIGKIYMITVACAIICMPVFMSIYLAWDFAYVNRSLKNQLQRVELLSKQAMEQQLEKKKLLEGQKEMLEQEVAARTAEVVKQKEEIERQHEELKAEKQKSDDLLLNILPAEVAEELKQKGHTKARMFHDVTVLFTDFVNFTHAGEQMTPDELVNELHTCFKAFDEIISGHGIEKIKTIGDAYLAVCGLPEPTEGHAAKVAAAALEIVGFMSDRRKQLGSKTFEIRAGIHSGSVVAGIVGVKKFAYDIWGDTVNTAARLEQHGEAGKVNISQTTYELVADRFACTYRGKIKAKNKGELGMYFIDGAL